MSNPVWPATLPQAPLVGWTDAEQSQSESTEVSVGPAKVRRRTTMTRIKRKLSMEMTGTQLGTLRTFYRTTCLGGTLEWDWTNGDPVLDSTVTYRFLSPPSVTNLTPSPSTSTRMYSVALDVETV